MPDLRPFRGLRYDAGRVPDLGAVLCPPYDVISASERELLLARSPYNAVRLELPAATTGEATAADFEAAGATLRAWTSDGTLRRDERPMLYVCEQHFTDPTGQERVARSFACELQLEQYGPGSGVRPHEHTLAGPREHRFRLLSAVRTHLSPVLLVYDDSAGRQDALFDELTAAPPRTGFERGVEHRVWAIDPEQSAAARELLAFAASQPLTIADGHHRYETAVAFAAEEGTPASALLPVVLVSTDDPGLEIFPTHRLFAEPRRLEGDAGGERTVLEVTREGEREVGVPEGMLDVHLVDSLGHDGISYTASEEEARRAVEAGEAAVAYILQPTRIEDVFGYARRGEVLPQKTTYFFPKLISGLLFHPL